MGTIVARGLRKTYRSDGAAVHALDGVDISVGSGEFVAIMGPSGCGKSTLLHMLGALDDPDSGEVALGDRQLTGLGRADLALVRRRSVGFVFQFFNLVPVLTVEENVVLPASLDGVSRDEYSRRASDLLDVFGLTDRRDLLPAQISGGEQQRAAIARALINEPDVLLADEPTGNLDRASGADVMRLFRDLNTRGQTIVIVTHDPAVASQASRVLFMRDGSLVDERRITERGDPTQVLEALARFELPA